mgnify:FL=1
MSQDETFAHFGLGSAPGSVHRVQVEWPASAIVQTIRGLPGSQRLIVHEPRRGDFDADGDVDADDWLLLYECLGGPQADRNSLRCARATDLRDVAAFAEAFSPPRP